MTQDASASALHALEPAAIVAATDDAVIGKTLDGIITSWNPAAERLYGYPASVAVGRHISLIVPPNRMRELEAILQRLALGQRIEHFDTVWLHRDGLPVDVSISISPISDHTGRVLGAAAIAREVGRRKEMEVRLRALLARAAQAVAEASDASRAKDEHLALVSHELRTPLTSMLGFVQLLQHGRLKGTAQSEVLDALHHSAQLQVRLVNDLLDVSRLAVGALTLAEQSIDLLDVVQRALAMVLPAANDKKIRLAVTVSAQQTAVRGDQDRLLQVVRNLLDNALKFTTEGGVVDVRLDGDGAGVRLGVADSGIGIPAEALPHVFERFWQLDASVGGGRPGLGLGLALVRSLVEAHGGRVSATSPGRGAGATFYVWLPLALA